MNMKQLLHDILLVIITVAIALAALAFHEYDKRQHGEQMYIWGYNDGAGKEKD